MNEKLESEKILNNIKSEANSIEARLNNSSIEKIKRKGKLYTKISLKVLKCILPNVLAAVIAYLPFKYNDNTLFKLDEKKVYLHRKTTITLDEKYSEEQYSSFDLSDSIINHYSPWYYEYGEYRRVVKTYKLGENDINYILNNYNNKLLEMTEEVTIQRKEILSEEELLNNKEYVEVITYDVDESKYLMSLETKQDNFAVSTVIISLIIVIELIVTKMCFGKYQDEIKRINEILEEDNLSRQELEKLLEIKKSNYLKLTKGEEYGK